MRRITRLTTHSRLRLIAVLLSAIASLTSQAESLAPSPIKLAVFTFELQDFGPAASMLGESQGDRYHLMLATSEARRVLAQSGRYQVISIDAFHGVMLQNQSLQDCQGCESRIAEQFGADQSLLVIVTRISMTDYTMTYLLRDAKSGALLQQRTTDLRMGANYSWSRGAAWLMNKRLLNAEER